MTIHPACKLNLIATQRTLSPFLAGTLAIIAYFHAFSDMNDESPGAQDDSESDPHTRHF